MLASIMLFRQLSNINKNQMCQNSITINSNQYNYCLKTQNINQLKLVNEMYMSQKYNQQIFLYTEHTKHSIIDLRVFNYNVNSFSLFGFVIYTQGVKDSQINISLNFEVFQGALICIKCDVHIMNCTLIFIATGVQLSALVVEVNQLMSLQQSFIQYRVVCSNSSGLINVVNTQINFSVVDCKLTGDNLIESKYSGFIAAVISTRPNLVSVNNFIVCTNNISALGDQSISIQFDVKLLCDICGEYYMVYGLCLDSLHHGQQVSGTMQCVHPFTFTNNQCVCEQGYILDNQNCIDILKAILNMTSVDNSGLSKRVTYIESIVQQLDISISQNVSQLRNQMQTVQSTLESYMASNYSSLDANLQSNITALDNRIRGNTTLLANNILSNTSALENNIAQNTTALDWRIYYNITALNLSFTNTTNIITQNIQILQYNLTALDNYTRIFQQNQSQLNKEMKQVISSLELKVKCLNNDGKYIDGLCLAKYTVNCSDNSTCSQLIYLSSFDHNIITYSITTPSNFSNGYVFNAANIIQNSFIDISDSIYSANVNPLFLSQSSFTNLKIQFGAQSLSSGSFITSASSHITISQLNIVSKSGTQITVNANSQLNILTNSLSGATISNLLVNLSFALSAGNITLINSVNGVLNISGYQILGDYISTLTVAMIGINVQTVNVNVNQISFKPNTFNVGNGSSYLFGCSVSAMSTFVINNIAVVIGNSSNIQILGSISTNNSETNYCQFGGIIAFINKTSLLNINNIIIDSYQKFSTSYVSNSGILVGFIQSSQNTITINNICLKQQITNITLQFYYFGLIGRNYGSFSIQNALVIFSVQSTCFQHFGIVGNQETNSIYAEIINLRTSVSVSSDRGKLIGSLYGYLDTKNFTVQNSSVVGGNISCGSDFVGGIIGWQQFSITIINVYIQNTNLSGANHVGGVIGDQSSNTNTTIMNFTIQNTNVSGSRSAGGIIGRCDSKLFITNAQIQTVRIKSGYFSGVVIGSNRAGKHLITNSTARSNYINGVLQTECAYLSNTWSDSGC
ncbi:carboxypeptidase_regulatory-like domain-containing protein [Hexamita inflata]|uniref:Carboxypeptidase regulatory-like domain-containing protein n=1 Tax=Hexamita inflata TaxID=28002 RepID=A0AA86P2T7_9EUKA|nr:carboxypeptidase regulatory-like domain-containing protein [Hexamita inflata]